MNAFLHGLDPAADRFLRRISRTAYEPGRVVVDFDDSTSDVFFIESGKVRIVLRNPGGRELILDDAGPGEIIGDMAAIDRLPRSASITTLHRSVIARMPGDTFRAMIAEVPEAARRMMSILTGRIRLGNQRLLEIASLGLKYRLYAELLRQGRPRTGGKAGAGGGPDGADAGPSGELVISPPPLQHVLASRVGGRREAVSREIASLLRAGHLRRTPGALVIVRPAELERQVRAEMDR